MLSVVKKLADPAADQLAWLCDTCHAMTIELPRGSDLARKKIRCLFVGDQNNAGAVNSQQRLVGVARRRLHPTQIQYLLTYSHRHAIDARGFGDEEGLHRPVGGSVQHKALAARRLLQLGVDRHRRKAHAVDALTPQLVPPANQGRRLGR